MTVGREFGWVPTGFGRHLAALGDEDPRPAATRHKAETAAGPGATDAPAWHRRRRLAPPGPGTLVMPAPAIHLPLALPQVPATAVTVRASLAEPVWVPVLEPVAPPPAAGPSEILAATTTPEPMPEPVSEPAPAPAETETAETELVDVEPAPAALSWAFEPAAPEPEQEPVEEQAGPSSLFRTRTSVTERKSHRGARLPKGLPWRRRAAPDAEPPAFWDVEPTATEAAIPAGRRANWRWRITIAVVLCAVLLAAGGLILVLPRLLPGPPGTVAVFNAPMIVVRAATAGRITSVAIKTGQLVDPTSLLLVIHSDPRPEQSAMTLRTQIETLQSQLAALNDSLAQAVAAGDGTRARGIELRRQRDSVASDLSLAQADMARITAPMVTDTPILAGVHGVIWSLEAQAGALASPGTPLVRLVDCDHPFLTIAAGSGLKAGDAVTVHLPDLPPVRATVRAASGVAEPPSGLVVAPAPDALPRSCPIGASATVSPIGKTS